MRALAVSLYLIFLPVIGAAQEFNTLKGHGGPIMDINVNQKTGQVATASFDNSVGLWKGRVPTWLEGHKAAVTSVLLVDDDVIISGGDDFRVLLWGPTLSVPLEAIQHRGKVSDIAIYDTIPTFASASWDGTIALQQFIKVILTNDTVQEPFDLATKILTGHDAGVNDIEFAEDGRLFSASSDGTIRVWETYLLEPTSRVLVSHGFGVNRLVVGPDDAWLAYGSVDGVTRVVDPVSGEILADFTLERRPILSMAYHKASNQLAVGDGHGYIMMIDTNTWQITRDFRAMRRGPVWALDFAPDGKIIYAGGLEDVVYSWPVALLDGYEPADGPERSFLRNPEDMPNGERQFMRKCSICHALTPPPSRKAGPSLHGVFGRQAGTAPGYSYSDILTGSDIIWSDDTIDALFDLGPDHYIPGSKMPMQRITAAQDRQDLIKFLHGFSGGQEN